MGSTEHIDRVTDLRTWPGDFPVSHLYTMGVAGERFFRQLKDSGRIMGSRCSACAHVYLPPSMYCPRCFAALDEWLEVGPRGAVRAVTITHRGMDGEPLDAPERLALIQLDGADDLLLHRLDGAAVAIGAKVEAVLKVASEREGSILDIRHFRAV
jgi:hypothetical protein